MTDLVRWAAGIEYLGTDFGGWQRQAHQPHAATIQGNIEHALSAVANQPVQVQCAGRTDAGVHAFCQVVHFDVPVKRDAKAWVLGGNTHLPKTIRMLWAKPVPADFHARFSAQGRRYQYRLLRSAVPSAIWHQYATHYPYELDCQAMHQAAQVLVGEHDFSSFRAAGCQSQSPMRELFAVSVVEAEQWAHINVHGNAFLYHMVRNIVGSLLAVGRKEKPIEWMATLLAQRDRTQAAPTAPAHGLYFVEVDYPDQYDLPTSVHA